jgi:hypothetical protein
MRSAQAAADIAHITVILTMIACKLYQIKKKYNITDEREALYTALKSWTAEIEVYCAFCIEDNVTCHRA